MMNFKPRLSKIGQALLLIILWAATTNVAVGQAKAPQFVAGEIILYCQPGTPQADVNALAAKVQATKVNNLLLRDCYHLILPAAKHTDADTLAAVATLKGNPGVRWVGPNRVYKPLQATTATPNDPRFKSGEQWNLKMINMPQAWVLQKGAANVNIAFIDSGFQPMHEDAFDAAGNSRFSPGSFDMADNDADVTADGNNADANHGTFTSGIAIAGTDNNKGIAGICWQNTQIVALKVQNKGQTAITSNGAAILNSYGYLFANMNKYHIVACNMSYGRPGDPTDVNDPEYVGIKQLVDSGMIMVASAGNDPLVDSHTYMPAGLPFVITVSALNPAGTLANYSSFGKVDISAPGGEQAANNDPNGVLSLDVPNNYLFAQGTSAAAPHVTAVATLLMSVPGMTPSAATKALLQSANHTGLGALPDPKYGFGKLDAYAALALVSVRVAILAPQGIDPTGGNASVNTTTVLPVQTFKPVVSVQFDNVPQANAVIKIDGQSFTVADLVAGKVSQASQVASGVDYITFLPGNSTANPLYNVTFRWKFSTSAPFQHTVVATSQNLASPVTPVDTRAFTILPHTLAAGLSFISIPYLETSADAGLPDGQFRDVAQFLGPDVKLYRYVNERQSVSGVTAVLGTYVAFGAGSSDSRASLRPSDTVTSTVDKSIPDARPLGLGYFASAPVASQVITWGSGAADNKFVTVPLQEGWNMIGTPYTFAVPFNTLEIVTPLKVTQTIQQAVDQKLIMPFIYRFVGGEYQYAALPGGVLNPWEGNWIYVVPKNPANLSTTSALTLVFSPAGTTTLSRSAQATRAAETPTGPSISGPGSWAVRLVARTRSLTDSYNFIGMTSRATDSDDATKVPKPPQPGPYVSLGIVRPNSIAGVYAQDLRPIGGVKTWNVAVNTDQTNADVSLSWPDIHTLPRNYRLTLTDNVSGQTIDLRHQSSYTFNSGANATTRSFTLTARPGGFGGRALLTNVYVNPGRTDGRSPATYEIGYTVTQDVRVEASILSFSGKVLAQIGATRAANTGDNRVVWNGRDSSGKPLSAGTYVLQLRAITADNEVTRVIEPFVITGR
jgi:hypothetical protein